MDEIGVTNCTNRDENWARVGFQRMGKRAVRFILWFNFKAKPDAMPATIPAEIVSSI